MSRWVIEKMSEWQVSYFCEKGESWKGEDNGWHVRRA